MNIQTMKHDSIGHREDEVPEHAAASGGFSLVDFLRMVRIHRSLIAICTVIVVILTAVTVSSLTPRYSATASVMLDQRKNSVADASAVLSDLGTDPATMQNQVQILTSLQLANRVVTKLKLDRDPEFNPEAAGWSALLQRFNPLTWISSSDQARAAADDKELEKSAVAHAFLDRLSVAPVGLSTAINITFASQSPAKAKLIANAIADAYVEDQLEAKFSATQKATQWLSDRIAELSRKAQSADEAVQQYKAIHNLTTMSGGSSIVDQQTAQINGQLVMARTQMAEKMAAYSGLMELAKSGRAADSAAAMSSPVISALRNQQSDLTRQLADMSSRYLPGHPKILDLEAQKATVDTKIAEEVQRIANAAKNDVNVSAAHVGSLQGSLRQLEGQGVTQNQAAVQLTALQSAATSSRSMYEAFLGRLNQTQGQEGIQTPDARIISAAEMPQRPSFPNKTMAIGAAIPIGLILGLLLAFAAERLDNGFRTATQLEGLLGLPVLSSIPEWDEDGDPSKLILEKPASPFAEAIRGLQLGVSLANVDREAKVVVIASSVPGEGKSTVALSLARLVAQSGKKVMLIDGDLRRPSLAKRLGLGIPAAGIVEAVTGSEPLEKCIVKDPDSAVFFLGCAKLPPVAADFLASDAMAAMMSKLAATFDLIVIDSAPLLPVNDTRILLRFADATLFIVRWEKTPREAAVNAARILKDLRVPIAGVALARADTERFRYYNYGYQNYQEYEKYYAS